VYKSWLVRRPNSALSPPKTLPCLLSTPSWKPTLLLLLHWEKICLYIYIYIYLRNFTLSEKNHYRKHDHISPNQNYNRTRLKFWDSKPRLLCFFCVCSGGKFQYGSNTAGISNAAPNDNGSTTFQALCLGTAGAPFPLSPDALHPPPRVQCSQSVVAHLHGPRLVGVLRILLGFPIPDRRPLLRSSWA